MNDSAVANHVVNPTVRVYSHVPVSSLNKHKNKNCISAHRSAEYRTRGHGEHVESVRRTVKGGPMAPLELSAHMTVRPGCLEGFKNKRRS